MAKAAATKEIAPQAEKERPVRLYSTATKGRWIKADDTERELNDGTGTPIKEVDSGSRKYVTSTLIDCLTTTNLVVLAGLGTSLCVHDSTGKRLAPGMTDLWNAVHAAFPKIDEVKLAVHYSADKGKENIEVFLSKCKSALDFLPDGNGSVGLIKNFMAVAEKTIKEQCSFIKHDTDLPYHESFLRKVARRSGRKPRAKIFTTNYDLCFEMAASHSRFVVVDGFSHATPQSYDPVFFSYDVVRRGVTGDTPDYIESVFHLYKLHGSLDWERVDGEIMKNTSVERPLLIYPRASKYQQAFEAPYIDMMAALQASVRQSDTALIVAGFGFNDDHISEPIMSALQANMNLRVVVVDPFFYREENNQHEIQVDALSNPRHEKLYKLINQGDSRISLISTNFENFVDILPDMVAETDRERHADRFRKIRGFEDATI